jgi:hypothetical protein
MEEDKITLYFRNMWTLRLERRGVAGIYSWINLPASMTIKEDKMDNQ